MEERKAFTALISTFFVDFHEELLKDDAKQKESLLDCLCSTLLVAQGLRPSFWLDKQEIVLDIALHARVQLFLAKAARQLRGEEEALDAQRLNIATIRDFAILPLYGEELLVYNPSLVKREDFMQLRIDEEDAVQVALWQRVLGIPAKLPSAGRDVSIFVHSLSPGSCFGLYTFSCVEKEAAPHLEAQNLWLLRANDFLTSLSWPENCPQYHLNVFQRNVVK